MMDGSAESVVKVDSSHDDLSLDGLGRNQFSLMHSLVLRPSTSYPLLPIWYSTASDGKLGELGPAWEQN